MKKLAPLMDDLLAVRRGELAFDAVAGRVSTHLTNWPQAAGEVLQEVQVALEKRIIEPEEFQQLKTIIVDTISQRRVLANLPGAGIPGSQRGADPAFSMASPPPSGGAPTGRTNIALGSRLRDRFILDEVLGVGGMGIVYKGRDLLKVEARDRNPYVAIKVLKEDFKKRPDAFIMLQREASRQQRLAHPNVVTVYDFDRTGDTIFISMELLEGTPLDIYLRTNGRDNGVPFEEAIPLIEGMCAALMYAHEHGIVHADFKPSNCFVMQGGKVKVLDFGIARAMRRPNQAEGDVTVYDGRLLGAMTPAYASPEMAEESADPDPRDDIYGLACVCYELLTGDHPFDRLSAIVARGRKLSPKPVPSLSPRQNRALAHALAFDREARTPTVREFFNGLRAAEPPQRWRWNKKTAGIGAAIVLLIAAGGVWWTIEYPVARTIADLESGNDLRMQAGIERLATFSTAERAQALAAAREEIIAHYREQIRAMLDSGEIDAAYGKAEAMFDSALKMYPDAPQLVQLRDEVATRKQRYLSELAEQYEVYLAAGRLLSSKEHSGIQGVIQRIRLVEPRHPLLVDPRLAGAFAAAAEAAIDANQLDNARTLLADGTRLAPRDQLLRDVADKLESAEQTARVKRRSGELAAQIESQLPSLTSLERLAAVSDALVGLHDIAPGHAVFGRVAANVRPLLGRNYEVITGISTVDDIVAFERRYVAAFEAAELNEAASRVRERRERLVARRDELLAQARLLAAAPGARTPGGASIGAVIDQLRAIAPTDPNLDAIITAAVSEQRREAQRLSGERKWDEARAVLSAALALGDGDELKGLIAQDMARIRQREQDSARESLAAEREAARAAERERIAAAEAQVRNVLDSFAPTSAGLQSLGTRISALAALDPGNPLIQSARAGAAQRISASATGAAKAGKFDAALALLGEAAVHLPGVADIPAARSRVEALQVEAARQAQDRALAGAREAFRAVIARAQPAEGAWQREADAALAALRRTPGSENAATAAREQLASTYLDAAGRLIDEKRFTVAAQLLDKAEQLTPKSAALQTKRTQWTQASERNKVERAAEELAARVDAAKQRFASEIKAGRFDRARTTLAELQKIAPKDDVFVVREAPAMLADAVVASAQARLKSGDIAAAWQLVRSNSATLPNDPRFKQLVADIDTAASRRIDTLLGSRETIDRAALKSLVDTYRAAAPESYRSRNAAWLATIKRRLGDLSSDPAAHNAYLAAVQGALVDVPALQSLRAVEPKPAAATPSPQVAASAPAPASTSTISTNATVTSPTAVAPAVQQPAAAAPPAAEPNLLGNWCGEGVGLAFAANEYSFELGGGRTIKYPVVRYERAGSVVTMSWTDKNLGPMVTEFGEFSADGQSMVQMRGKTAASPQWQTYNRRFRRCK
jgi:serine/threonine protein kinase/tetratricopeptide (TPR) repeat protein